MTDVESKLSKYSLDDVEVVLVDGAGKRVVLVGYGPGLIILDEVHHMDGLHPTALGVMNVRQRVYQQKYGPRDRWGKCK